MDTKHKNEAVKFFMKKGFSIIEVIVVVGIISILMILSLTTFKNYSEKNHFQAAERILERCFNLARQVAIARNQSVEIRFYSLKSQKDQNDQIKYNATQVVIINSNQREEKLTKVELLQNNIYISFYPNNNESIENSTIQENQINLHQYGKVNAAILTFLYDGSILKNNIGNADIYIKSYISQQKSMKFNIDYISGKLKLMEE